MKKILVLLISLSILASMSLSVFSAENSTHIEGLDRCLDKICLNSDINAEIRETMQQANEVYLQNRVNEIMGYPDYAKQKMGLKLGDDKYIEEQIRDGYGLDMERGLLISSMSISKYLNQYAKAGCFSYLLSENNIFKVNRNKYGVAVFSEEGRTVTDSEIRNNYIDIVDDSIFTYINDSEQIRSAIAARGETIVRDIKIFGLGYLTVLYIKCELNEYLIKLHDREDRILPKIKSYALYTANEFIEAFNDIDVQNSPYSQVLSQLVLETKPTYDTEAESLQSDGLLYGNEKGLDLLKPLTRIEATAILVRAMGYENAETEKVSYFSDIASENWGAKYANIARDKGIAAGVGDGLFAPNDMVTASQFATLILRNIGENPDWQTAINIFVERGIITSEQAEKMDLFTRGDMAKIIYEAKRKSLL